MALLTEATCPKCGQVHAVTGVHSVFGTNVQVCGECLVREARDTAENAKQEAYAASRRRFGYGERANTVVDHAEKDVTVRLLCEGGFSVPPNLGRRGRELQVLKNLRRYWERVREEIER